MPPWKPPWKSLHDPGEVSSYYPQTFPGHPMDLSLEYLEAGPPGTYLAAGAGAPLAMMLGIPWQAARGFKELGQKYPGMTFELAPYKTQSTGKTRQYTVYINKSYFPKDQWPQGEGRLGDLYESTKVKAQSRTEAAFKAWDAMGRKWLNEMSPFETSQRKISLHVDEPSMASYDRGIKYMGGGAASRLSPIHVLTIKREEKK